MALTTALLISGAAIIGTRRRRDHSDPENRFTTWRKAMRQKFGSQGNSRRQTQLASLLGQDGDGTVAITAVERRLNREMVASGASLAVTIAGTLFYPPLQLLSLPVIAYSLVPIYRDAYRSARAKQFDVNVLYAITQSLVIGRGYLLPANLGAFYYFLSRKLLLMAEDRYEVHLQELFGQLPNTVHKLVDGVEVPCRLEDIAVTDQLAVHAGETIPVDGIIVAGVATVDQQRLTGEAQPVEKEEGALVYASTVVLAGTIHVQVNEAGTATIVAQIGTILEATKTTATDRQLWGKLLGDRLVLPLLALGGASVPFVGLEGAQAIIDGHPQRRMNISTALCALNYLAEAAEAGLLIKDGRALELLQQVDTIIFDKTGTLTLDEPHVAQIYPIAGFREAEILRYAAVAETHQEHPIARAILEAARAQTLTVSSPEEAEYHVGFGLHVYFEQKQIRVGSERFLTHEGIAVPAVLQEQLAVIWEHGNSAIFVAVEDRVAGLIELRATVRPEAAAICQMAQQQGWESYILSGDHEAPTRRLATDLGFTHYRAGILPEEKAAFVTRLQEQGRTICFIGDGINDAIAMKQADVAISLRGATTAATETAQIVLMEADLEQLRTLLNLATRYTRNQRATVGVFLTGTTIAVTGAYLLGFGLWHVANLNMVFFPLSLGVAMWPRLASKISRQ